MNPDWMIDKDDGVCSSCTCFDLIPRAEPVNEPAVALMHGLDCLPQRWFCCPRPPCLVLYRIDLSQWQIIVLGNLVCQRGLSATTVPDNHHSVHRDRHSLHSASTVAATLLFLCNTGPPNGLPLSCAAPIEWEDVRVIPAVKSRRSSGRSAASAPAA